MARAKAAENRSKISTKRSGGRREGAGRPKGAPNKDRRDIRAAAQKHGPAALAEIVRLMSEAESEQTRLAAAREVMDRAYGKAPQAHTGEGGEGPIKHQHAVTWLTQAEAQQLGWA